MRIFLSLAIILSAACSGGVGDDTADVDALPADAAIDTAIDAPWTCAERCTPAGGTLREMCFGSTTAACVVECDAGMPGVAWCPL